MMKQVYLTYSNNPTISLVAFGNGQKGKLANGIMSGSNKS